MKPRDYWYRLKKREKANGIELSTNCRQFKLTASDGKLQQTEIAGDARKALEIESGKKIITKENYLPENNQGKIGD